MLASSLCQQTRRRPRVETEPKVGTTPFQTSLNFPDAAFLALHLIVLHYTALRCQPEERYRTE